jgi:hypothetical protein
MRPLESVGRVLAAVRVHRQLALVPPHVDRPLHEQDRRLQEETAQAGAEPILPGVQGRVGHQQGRKVHLLAIHAGQSRKAHCISPPHTSHRYCQYPHCIRRRQRVHLQECAPRFRYLIGPSLLVRDTSCHGDHWPLLGLSSGAIHTLPFLDSIPAHLLMKFIAAAAEPYRICLSTSITHCTVLYHDALSPPRRPWR